MSLNFTPPPTMRTKVTPIESGLELEMPARRSVSAVAFSSLWLVIWAVIGYSFVSYRGGEGEDSTGGSLAMLLLWSALGAPAIFAWLWNIMGKERLCLSPNRISFRLEMLRMGIGNHYDPSLVRNFRAVDVPATTAAWFWTSPVTIVAGGPLAFDYGARTVRLGAGIDYAEAVELARRITTAATWLNSEH
ncbi:hypothetical protein [Dokdonella ginsengisoli]|uniref:DUF304 domain-containing protein n=1 Tax=Dokdonella ginsengisoli TaxID=363846 RepID=A0ABV9QXI9_9GAMM